MLRKWIYRNYFKRDSFKIYNRNGFSLLLNYANYIDRKLIIKEGFEEDRLDFLFSVNDKKPTIFIDVGANIGIYTLTAARKNQFDRIISFEPDTRNCNQLGANIVLNGFNDDVVVHQLGLSNVSGTATFLKNKGSSTGTSRLASTAPDKTKTTKFEECSIKVAQLDDLLKEEGQVIFMKIDVEGHEELALEGMVQLLERNHCKVQLEIFEKNVGSVSLFFSKLGYSQINNLGDDYYFEKQA